MLLDELRTYKPQILAKAAEYGIENIRVALPKNGTNGTILDEVTLVVDFKPGVGWGFFSFAEDIEKEVLCRRVHVLTDDVAAGAMYKPVIDKVIPL